MNDEFAPRQRPVPVVYHMLAATFVTLCAWAAIRAPDSYAMAMQEDRAIEWLSVLVFATAGVIALARARRERRVFDALVALFLLFVAGEEMSWGQRLLGLTPPSYFLEHNTQQEMNLHNFAGFFGSPKGPFTAVLLGYAVLLPAAAAIPRLRPLLERIGATAPPLAAIAWFLVAIALLVWYPFRFTGEWVELLAGSAFLVSTRPAPKTLAVAAPLLAAGAVGLQWVSTIGRADAASLACATSETAALATVAGPELSVSGAAHKRVWTMVQEERLDADALTAALAAVSCAGERDAGRRSYFVDPWGTAYWVRVEPVEEGRLVTVYSFGPNRRRDQDGDDIAASWTPAAP